MSRRGRWLLAVLVAALVLAALLAALVWRQMQPERLTPLLLRQASQALGLEFRVREPAEYALRPEPRLLLRGLSAHRPGEDAALLSAERAELSLPWATLRGRGLTISRIDLHQPRLDLPELQAWMDARPRGDDPVRLPTLTRGLALADASVVAPDWRIDGMDVDLPHFQPGRATRLEASGRLQAAGRVLPFVAGLEGSAQWASEGPVLSLSALSLQARDGTAADAVAYHLATAGQAGFEGGRAWLEAPAAQFRIDAASPDANIVLGLRPLKLAHASGATSLERSAFVLTGGSAVPPLEGHLQARLGELLEFRAQARMDHWPEPWPALPEPLASAGGPFLATLGYQGPLDLGEEMALELTHEQAVLESRFVLPVLLQWSLPATGSPLPPLSGRLQATAVQLGNTRLQGVSVVVRAQADGDPADAAAGAAADGDRREGDAQ